ncbi:FxSxx-COOH system tetratricopeptide repeat protein [Streptomyces collinus]|uniref:FxSxx-COOH system tetratricopeptide repeat protein n=1 Tax=Streptomyces collinus TaxID=42684 RepID=UPI0037950408
MTRGDFYISYHPADLAWAEWIAWRLEADGYRTVVQDWDLRPGENLIRRRNEALEQCHYTLAVVSAAYLAAPQSSDDWTAAFLQDAEGRERLICVLVDDSPLPALLRSRYAIDLAAADDDEDAAGALLGGVRSKRGKPTVAPPFPRRDTPAPRLPAQPPHIFEVPPRNPNFTGRLDLLRHLADRLDCVATVVQAALHGLGGIGKTQVAIEYAHRYAPAYDIVWWVAAEQPAVLLAGLAALGARLDIKVTGDQQHELHALYSELRRRGRWLIIFDNAEDPELLYPLLPSGGHVLITSRNPDWAGLAEPVALHVLNDMEATTFLAKRLRNTRPEHHAELAAELGNLPLALEQAAAYIDATQISVSDYLRLLRSSTVDAFPTRPPLGYPRTVSGAWVLSLDRIRDESEDAHHLLTFCSFLAPDGIPRKLLRTGSAGLPGRLRRATSSARGDHVAVAALRRYSLVDASPDDLALHRLVQWIVRQRAGDSPWPPRTVVTEAVGWLLLIFPAESGEPRHGQLCERLLPHVLAVREHAADYGVSGPELATLLERAAEFLHAAARLTAARELFEAATAMWATASDEDSRHPQAALSADLHYGRLLHDLGEIPQARKIFERAERRLRAVTADAAPPQLVTVLTDLGRLLQEEGDLRGAKLRIEEVVSLVATTDIPVAELARAYGCLGRIEQDLGNMPAARLGYEKALALSVEAFGESDSRAALRRNSLAGALHLTGRIDEAMVQLSTALAALEAVYGADHDRTVAVRLNLAAALHVKGRYEQAHEHYRHAERICARLGLEKDPRVAMIRTGLGALLHDSADLEGALEQHRQALALGRAQYEPGHPRMVVMGANAAATLERADALEEARELMASALESAVRLYGPSHPRVAAVRATWGVLLGRLAEPDAALAEESRALEDSVRVYGRTHSRVAVIENNLGCLVFAAASSASPEGGSAPEHLARAVEIAEAAYGVGHPRTLVIRENAAGCRVGRPPQALFIPLHIHQQATTIDR